MHLAHCTQYTQYSFPPSSRLDLLPGVKNCNLKAELKSLSPLPPVCICLSGRIFKTQFQVRACASHFTTSQAACCLSLGAPHFRPRDKYQSCMHIDTEILFLLASIIMNPRSQGSILHIGNTLLEPLQIRVNVRSLCSPLYNPLVPIILATLLLTRCSLHHNRNHAP
jgi:hypothetical protein